MYDRLRTFLEVYRHQSMGRAAKALSLTQPAVSNQIAALEQQFSAPLFERSRMGVSPTANADSLAMELAPLLDGLEAVIRGRLARASGVSGLIHIGAPPEFFSAFGGRMMAAFSGTKLRAQIHLGGQAFLYDGLEEGSLDICVLASAPRDRTLLVTKIGEETLQIFAHPQIAEAARGRTIDAAWLQEREFIAYDHELSLIRQFFVEAFGEPCDSKPTMLVPDLRSVAAICSQFPSWAVLPSYLAKPLVDAGRLKVLLQGRSVRNDFNLALKRASLRTARIAFARKELEAFWSALDFGS
ncbi:MAG: LysR family transcriptional regulator [Pseudomonadota bacterium]